MDRGGKRKEKYLSSTIPMILEGELWGGACREVSYFEFASS